MFSFLDFAGIVESFAKEPDPEAGSGIMLVEPKEVVITKLELNYTNSYILNENRVKIMHITDGHWGFYNYKYERDHEIMLSAIESENPDYIFYTGDMTHNCKNEEWIAVYDWLSKIDIPVLAIRGNHDSCPEYFEIIDKRNLSREDCLNSGSQDPCYFFIPEKRTVNINNKSFYLDHFPFYIYNECNGTMCIENISCEYDVCLVGHDHYRNDCIENMCFGGHFGAIGPQYSYRIIEIIDDQISTYSRNLPIILN